MSMRNRMPSGAGIPFFIMGIMSSLAVLAAGASCAAAQEPGFVVGEVMVKFRPNTEAGASVSRAARTSPPNVDDLAPVARLLTDKVAIPLRAKQLASGDWVVFHIDWQRLASDAAAQLRKRDGVADVQLRASELKGINVPDMKDLDVSFRPGSAPSRAIQEKVAGASETGFAALVEDLGQWLNLPMRGKPETGFHLILQVDAEALTSRLAERLGGLSDIIESAQLNYVMTGM